jgi:alcohol dehydrogenase class IV
MTNFDKARALLNSFKHGNYLNGLGILSKIGPVTAKQGQRAALVRGGFPGSDDYVKNISESLAAAGVETLAEIKGVRPNAPLEDLARLTSELTEVNPEVIVSFGGGSTIDATKAAEVLRTLGGEIEDYFGTGLVSQAMADSGKKLTPHVAIQTVASSSAHLTKYSNITDLETAQKKLIVDEATVPEQPVFDYEVTYGTPAGLTADGALDGISHCLEVFYGAVGQPTYGTIREVACEGIRLVVEYLPGALENPQDTEAREALGLATDLGGYAIMLGGTNGAHLTSFSLVDILSHGRACGMLNPYYSVFFAPVIQEPLQLVGEIYKTNGYTDANFGRLSGRQLGVAVAEAMITFEEQIGFPTTLGEVPGFGQAHIERALMAAKNPQLKMKLENMPISLTAEMVDEYMGPVLEAAKTGDLNVIKNV